MPLQAYAEDEPIDEPIIEEELEQSEWSKFYEEKIRPNVISFITAYFGGNISVGIALALVFRKLKNTANKAIDKMDTNNETKEMLKERTDKMLNKLEGIVLEKLDPYIEKVDNMTQTMYDVIEENKTLTSLVNSLTETVTTLMEKMQLDNTKIVKALEIAFTNNPDLVRNGYATAIKKELTK